MTPAPSERTSRAFQKFWGTAVVLVLKTGAWMLLTLDWAILKLKVSLLVLHSVHQMASFVSPFSFPFFFHFVGESEIRNIEVRSMRRPDRDCCTVCTPKCRRHHQLIKLVISLQGGGLREIIHGLKIFSVFFFPLSVPSLYLAVRILRCPTLCSSVFNKVIAFLMILTGTFILQLNFKLKL